MDPTFFTFCLETLGTEEFGFRYWPQLLPPFVTCAPVHAHIMVECVSFHICPGSAHSLSQRGYFKVSTGHSPTDGQPDSGSLSTPYHCLGFRLLELCGLPLVNLAFCVWKSFLPRPYISYRSCCFQGPQTSTETEKQQTA